MNVGDQREHNPTAEVTVETKIANLSPLVESARRLAHVEVGGREMGLYVKRLDVPPELFRAMGGDVVAEYVGDHENSATADVVDEIESGNTTSAIEHARDAIDQSKEAAEYNDVFHRAVLEHLKTYPNSLYQVQPDGFSPEAIDGFFNQASWGKRIAGSVQEGNVYIIAPDTKDTFLSAIKHAQEGFINRFAKENRDFYSTETRNPFRIIDQTFIPEESGFTLFYKQKLPSGQIVESRMFFLYAKTVDEETGSTASNTNQEISETETLDEKSKAA